MLSDIAIFEALPQFRPVIARLRGHDAHERLLAQQRLLDAIDHSMKASLLAGVLELTQAERLHRFSHRCLEGMARLLRSLTEGDPSEPTFDDFLAGLDRHTRAAFVSTWQTSLLNHDRRRTDAAARRAFRSMPTYIECGFDFLVSGGGPSFSEVQLCSATRPHCNNLLSEAYRSLHPELVEEVGARREDYLESCLELLGESWRMFSERCSGPARRTVIDAWARLAHSGQSHLPLASRLGSCDYRLFDELRRDSEASRELVSGTPFNFIYNQPAIFLLDGHDAAFDDYRRADIETYPELGVEGLWQKYREGRVFLSASPLVDVFNDKAMMAFMPEIVAFFTGERLGVPVVGCEPLWELDHPNEPAGAAIARALLDKDAWVLCHRYLEGGQGIKIGASLPEPQWQRLFDVYVARHPSHFILRPYVRMAPAQSLRVPACGLFDAQDGVEITRVAQGLMGRMSAHSPIDNVAEGGTLYWCFVGAPEWEA